MLEIIELCRKYGVSINFDYYDDLKAIIGVRIFKHSSGRCLRHVFPYEELNNVADKNAYITNAMKRLLDSILLEQ